MTRADTRVHSDARPLSLGFLGNPSVMKNTDTNYRVKAGENIPAGSAVYIDASGLAQVAEADNTSVVWGICPEDVPSGEVVPVMRSGKVEADLLPLASGCTPAVGDKLYLTTAGEWDHVAAVGTGYFVLPLLTVIEPVGPKSGGALIHSGNLA